MVRDVDNKLKTTRSWLEAAKTWDGLTIAQQRIDLETNILEFRF